MATTISLLRPSLEGVDIHRWIVLQKGAIDCLMMVFSAVPVVPFPISEGLVDIKGEKLQALHVADESASVILCVSAEVAGFLRPGDICELKSGHACLCFQVPTLAPFSSRVICHARHTEYANGSLYLIAGKSAKVVRQGECVRLLGSPFSIYLKTNNRYSLQFLADSLFCLRSSPT